MDERICALCKKRVDGPMKHFVGEDLESFATCMACAPKAKQRQFETVEQTKRQLTTESNTYLLNLVKCTVMKNQELYQVFLVYVK